MEIETNSITEPDNNNLINNYKNEECSICLDNLTNEVCLLSCGHYFHYNCLGQWIFKCKNSRKAINCPLCKQEFEITNIIFHLDKKKYTYKNYNEFKKKYDKRHKTGLGNRCTIL